MRMKSGCTNWQEALALLSLVMVGVFREAVAVAARRSPDAYRHATLTVITVLLVTLALLVMQIPIPQESRKDLLRSVVVRGVLWGIALSILLSLLNH